MSDLQRLFRFADALDRGCTVPEAGDAVGLRRRQSYAELERMKAAGVKYEGGRITDWGPLNPYYYRYRQQGGGQ